MKQVVFVLALTFGLTLSAFAQSADESALRDIEQRLHDAKLKNDVATLDRYLHADYFGTNQSGNQRDKQKMLQLFKTFPIQSLSTKVLRVHVSGDTAVVTGTLDERSGTGNDHMLFTHSYLRTREGWQLLGAHQSVYDAGAPYDGTSGRSTRAMFVQLAGGGRGGASPESTAARTVTQSGLTVEEVRVGGSCIVVVSRGTEQLAVTGCNPR
jgi:ketosteroid isomerase-like protein